MEGINNKLKLIKRRGYGFRNFDNFRLRSLLCWHFNINSPCWLTNSGELDTDALLQAVLKFWRQHGEPLLGSAVYHEIAPHLVLMAFLHRVDIEPQMNTDEHR